MHMANVSPNAIGPNATYIPSTRVGLAWGLWGLALGRQGFSDINMLVLATRNSRVGSLDQREAPKRRVCIAVEYRLQGAPTRYRMY